MWQTPWARSRRGGHDRLAKEVRIEGEGGGITHYPRRKLFNPLKKSVLRGRVSRKILMPWNMIPMTFYALPGKVLFILFIFSFLMFEAIAFDDKCLSFYSFENESDTPDEKSNFFNNGGWRFDKINKSFESGNQSIRPSIFWTTLEGPLNVSFEWKISSEEDGIGVFQFQVDGSPEIRCNNNSWTKVSLPLVVPDGIHKLTWIVFSGSSQPFTGWIDSLCIQKQSCRSTCPSSMVSNQIPTLLNFMPSVLSPQEVGASIIWMAEAYDYENDTILYKFFLDDIPVQNWSSNKSWNWNTEESDPGSHKIEVWIKDGKHAGPESFDDRRGSDFILNIAVNVTSAQRQLLPTPVIRGPILGYVGNEYTYSAEKNNSFRNIVYQFEYDGKLDVPSAQNEMTYRWNEPGEKNVRVRIIDENRGIEGNWSQLVRTKIYNYISVNSSNDEEIQGIIERLENYTEIDLTDGVYLFDEEIEIISRNNIIIQASNDRISFKGRNLLPRMISLIDCNNITIKNLKISNAKTELKINSCNNVNIIDNIIEFGGCYCGIKHISGERNNLMYNQLIYNPDIDKPDIDCDVDGDKLLDNAGAIILEKGIDIDINSNMFPTNINQYNSYYIRENDYSKNITITIPNLNAIYLIVYGNCQGSWNYSNNITPIVDTDEQECDIPDWNTSTYIWKPYQ